MAPVTVVRFKWDDDGGGTMLLDMDDEDDNVVVVVVVVVAAENVELGGAGEWYSGEGMILGDLSANWTVVLGGGSMLVLE